MKPIPAIVEQAIDLDKIRRETIDALRGESKALQEVASLTGKLQSATGAAKTRRLEVGRLLSLARPAYATRGPKAKDWGDYCTSLGIDDRTARRYMDEYADPEGFGQQCPKPPASAPPADEDDAKTGPRPPAPLSLGSPPPFREWTADEIIEQHRELNRATARLPEAERKRVKRAGKANLEGGSGDDERGTWTTNAKWARAVGRFDHDPFSNPRSKIESVTRCMLEDGGDGFGGVAPGSTPGLYLIGGRAGGQPVSGVADAATRVFIQPPFKRGFIEAVIAHYRHTRFTALLRFAPDTAWFKMLWPLIEVCAIPVERIDFDPPPGVPEPESTISYPHAIYYRDHRDVTDEVRALCLIWHVDHTTSAALPTPAQLHLVR